MNTAQQRRELHTNLRGIEKKPLPFLLGMMNLVLHGVGQPNIIRANALAVPITQITKGQRVDVVLTNPPFGGAEEASIQANFPSGKQTAETAWLFLQLVIRQLKDGGRCGIVVPHSILFAGGVGARIKEQLMTECDLHTIVRLPEGVFEPYTGIPANLLFFDKTGPTKDVWFYEILARQGRKKYTKTAPMQFEEFDDCRAWWAARVESERAWRVHATTIKARGYNLDLRNPRRPEDLTHQEPYELLTEIVNIEREIGDLVQQIQGIVENQR